MSKTETPTFTEHCQRCGRETPHSVTIEILTESRKDVNVEYSREPYRVSRCRYCGERSAKRMNKA